MSFSSFVAWAGIGVALGPLTPAAPAEPPDGDLGVVRSGESAVDDLGVAVTSDDGNTEVVASGPDAGADDDDAEVVAPGPDAGADDDDAEVVAPGPDAGADDDDAEVVAPGPDAGADDDDAEVVVPGPDTGADDDAEVAVPGPDAGADDDAEVVVPAPAAGMDDSAEVVAPASPGVVRNQAGMETSGSEPTWEVHSLGAESRPSMSAGGARAPAQRPGEPGQQRAGLVDHLSGWGFIQVDFLRRQISSDELSDGTSQPLNETGFVLRNARLGLRGHWRYFGADASVELFSNGEGVRPAAFDAHVQYPGKSGNPPWIQLRAGLLRVPFGFENADQNDVQRFFGERALVSHAFVPGLFDVGASLSGHVWALDWVVAVQNGQPVGAPGFGYRDPNAAKDFSGRLRLSGRLFRWLRASTGVSALWGQGFSAGTTPSKDSFDWVDLNEDGRVTLAELLPVPGSSGRPSENFDRWGVAADLHLRSGIPRLGEMLVYGEFVFGSNLDRAVAVADPVALGRDQRGAGWYAAITQELTRHAQVGFRYDDYLPNLDALEPFDGTTVVTRRRFQTFTAAAAGHLYYGSTIRARLLVEYEHQLNRLGRDSSGRPNQLDNDTLRVRAEVAF